MPRAWLATLVFVLAMNREAQARVEPDTLVRIRAETWTAADERGYGEFIAGIGQSNCRTVDSCLRNAANPFRASDPEGVRFQSDCADLPYVLRFYYAWKRGLPFSYVSTVSPRARARDIRYSPQGNVVEAHRDVLTGDDGLAVLERLRDEISSATYRIHPSLDGNDLYSPAVAPKAIRPGTVIYDPNGHLAVIWKIEADGRIRYIDAHPDNSLTRGTYDLRFVRSSPGMGAGFKNWRPSRLAGAARGPDGVLVGGRVAVAANSQIADFALAQYFGTGRQPEDRDWKSGVFEWNGAPMDYYDYVRARLGGGRLRFDPLREVAEMVASNCADLGYRADAVAVSLAAGIQNQPQPERLPINIFGTEGDWETWSTPSRDARLKTAFKEVRDNVQRFLDLWRARDPRLVYAGSDLVGDMRRVHAQAAAACSIGYVRSDGAKVSLGYEQARQRLFRMSFDPYQCVERRWGADGPELASCRDGRLKHRWYDAEQRLRNQIDRTYDARMDFSLDELEAGRGGVTAPPDTDVAAFLQAQQRVNQRKEKGR
jgi:hypothetical protein